MLSKLKRNLSQQLKRNDRCDKRLVALPSHGGIKCGAVRLDQIF